VASEPDALINWLKSRGYELIRVGLEAGPLSQWLFAAMREAGLAVELLETRHVRKAFEAMPVKSDRNDARGIRAADAARLVPAGALQVDGSAGSTSGPDSAQADPDQASGCREQPARDLARFGLKVGKTTDRSFTGRIQEVGEGPTEPGKRSARRCSRCAPVYCASSIAFEKRVRAMARLNAKNQAVDVDAGGRSDRGAHLCLGDRRIRHGSSRRSRRGRISG